MLPGMGESGWIYREGRIHADGAEIVRSLLARVAAVGGARGEGARRAAVEALVACGELEAGLDDAGETAAVEVAAITDLLAAAALGGPCDAHAVCARLAALPMPARVTTSVPEGFAYYALQPEAYARAAGRLAVRGQGTLVVGVRSIGTTLSAIACAALCARGEDASRITVRPSGAPHARRLELEGRQRAAVQRANGRDAAVLIVDEGPGMSGSTFLAVAEAVALLGVPDDRITLATSHEPQLASLSAPDAAARFARFRRVVAPLDVHAPRADADLSAGAWRRHVYKGAHREAEWPASFTQTERRKLLLPDGRLAKFEGLGRAGAAAATRAAALADGGWMPPARDEGDGWLSYPWAGAPLRRAEVDAAIVDRMAMYCARRSAMCPATAPEPSLEAMAAKNVALATGRTTATRLPIERLAVVDGHMAPHEWLRARDGRIVKVDGLTHGDDHFFPGPADIAWDLAGAIVEWELDGAPAERLLATYARASGDDPRARLPAWTIAYAAFRLAFTTAALDATRDPAERERLARDRARYLACVVG